MYEVDQYRVARQPAHAHRRAGGGWGSVHKYVKPSGNCAGQEVLASYYWTGKHTANGEAFDANGNTAAARTWPLGTTLTVTNPEERPLAQRAHQRPRALRHRLRARRAA